MPWSKLVSLELDDEDKIDACMPMPCDRPDFPYGTRISLSEKELKKLGLPVPGIGDMLDARVMGTVTSVSSEKVDGGEDRCRVEIQIERMAVSEEATEGTG